MKFLDDDILLAQKNISIEYKLFALQKKYEREPDYIQRSRDILLQYGNTSVFRLSQCLLRIEFVQLERDICKISGYAGFFPLDREIPTVYIEVNQTRQPCVPIKRQDDRYCLGEKILQRWGFQAEIPLSPTTNDYSIKFDVYWDNCFIENKNIAFGIFAPLSAAFQRSYYVKDGWKLTANKSSLTISACGMKEHIRSEYRFLRELWTKNKRGARKAVLARTLYHLLKPLKRRPIWIISDRILKADDNGEAFYKYLRRERRKDVTAYFAISKKSADYQRLKKTGPVVESLSFRHKTLHLLCDYNISSQADAITINPFPGYQSNYSDILSDKRFIFLQHGITKDDLSNWLNRYSKNLYGFVTAAAPEYQSIIEGNYLYAEKEVWLTGFPRYDRLYHNEQKIVAIMPTWRKYLMSSSETATGIWTLRPDFTSSRFFKFYHDLLNHPALLASANEHGYRLQFLPHPTLQPYGELFSENNAVELLDMNAKYRDVYATSDLVVSDYSSAVFDFAYLRKPLIYCQFDADEFFSGGHVYTKGYFDYERDGFGEVETTLEGTVNRIIEYMENACRLKDEYRRRIDRFFSFNDKDNCRRVYEKIKSLESSPFPSLNASNVSACEGIDSRAGL